MSLAGNVGVAAKNVFPPSVELKIYYMLCSFQKLYLLLPVLSPHCGHLVGARLVPFPSSCRLIIFRKSAKHFHIIPVVTKWHNTKCFTYKPRMVANLIRILLISEFWSVCLKDGLCDNCQTMSGYAWQQLSQAIHLDVSPRGETQNMRLTCSHGGKDIERIFTLAEIAWLFEQPVLIGATLHQSGGRLHCASPWVIGRANNWLGTFLCNVIFMVVVVMFFDSPALSFDSRTTDTLFIVLTALFIVTYAYNKLELDK